MASEEFILKLERLKREKEAKIQAALDHYARTEVPFDRIAQHVALPLADIVNEMRVRGRTG